MVDKTGKVYLYDLIGWEDVTALEFARVIQQMQEQGITVFDVHINSPGGLLVDGLAIYNLMKDLNCNVYIDGLAASAASLIAMGGKRIYMHESSLLMIHNPRASSSGDHRDMEKAAEVIEKFRDTAIAAYAAKTRLSVGQIAQWMDEEKWFNAAEALAAGLIDEVIKNPTNLAGAKMKEFLLQLLGLPQDADETALRDALAELKSRADSASALQQAASELKKKNPKFDELVERLESLSEQVTQLQTGNAALMKELQTSKAAAALDKAINSGKILPAQREDYLAEAIADPTAFAAKMEKRERIWDPEKGLKPENQKEQPQTPAQQAIEFLREKRKEDARA